MSVTAQDGGQKMVSGSPDDRPQKKIKITAENGCHKVAFWNGEFPDQKTPAPKRLQQAKLKLYELPSLPLDILYEVSINS
jgi:hypothetical protein